MTREEAIEEIKRWTPILLTSGQCTEETSKAQDMAISALSEELSEDGTLTVHVSDGTIEESHWECSKCGSGRSGWGEFKFCPDCGADMRGVIE